MKYLFPRDENACNLQVFVGTALDPNVAPPTVNPFDNNTYLVEDSAGKVIGLWKYSESAGEWVGGLYDPTANVTIEPTGFQTLASTIGFDTHTGYDPLYEFDSTSTTFTLTPTPEQVVWVNGTKFVKTVPESITIDGDGLHFLYYNPSGVLSSKTTYFDFASDAPVAYVYRVDGKVVFVGDERHGIVMDWATHEYLHRTRGAAYASGFNAGDFSLTGTGTTLAEQTISLTPGVFFDEDLKISIQDGTGGYFTQPLEPVAELPVVHRTDSGWVFTKATSTPFLTGTTRMSYNSFVGGTWGTTDVQNNHFGVMFVVATNNLLAPVVAIMGQDTYGSKGAAEATLFESVDLTGLPVYEFRPLYKLIYEVKDGYSNTGKASLRGVLDIRASVITSMGTAATQINDHGGLTGLADDDHPQYLNTDRADLVYLRETFETVSKNLKSADAVAVEDPSTGLLQTITYANGIVKTFAWTPTEDLASITLSGSTPAGIDLVKTFTWTASGFSFVYS